MFSKRVKIEEPKVLPIEFHSNEDIRYAIKVLEDASALGQLRGDHTTVGSRLCFIHRSLVQSSMQYNSQYGTLHGIIWADDTMKIQSKEQILKEKTEALQKQIDEAKKVIEQKAKEIEEASKQMKGST